MGIEKMTNKAPSSSHCSTDHAGRFRLAIVMPNGYGMDISWDDRNSLEEVLRLVVVCMDEEGGIDNAIKIVIDKILSATSPHSAGGHPVRGENDGYKRN